MKNIFVLFCFLSVSSFATTYTTQLRDGATVAVINPVWVDGGTTYPISQISDTEGLCKWAGLGAFVWMKVDESFGTGKLSAVIDADGTVGETDRTDTIEALFCKSVPVTSPKSSTFYSNKGKNADGTFTFTRPAFSAIKYDKDYRWSFSSDAYDPGTWGDHAVFSNQGDLNGVCKFFGMNTHVSSENYSITSGYRYFSVQLDARGHFHELDKADKILYKITCK